jgi:hypothetical protein
LSFTLAPLSALLIRQTGLALITELPIAVILSLANLLSVAELGVALPIPLTPLIVLLADLIILLLRT